MNDNRVRKAERFLSRWRLRWAGASALLGCVACCALPLLAGVGLEGGGAAWLWPGAELIVGGGVFLAVLGAVAVVWRVKRRQVDSGDACGIGGAPDRSSASRSAGASSCDCAPTPTNRRAADEPIVCTLDHRDMQTRVDEYRAVFRRIVHAERFDHGFEWRFRWDADVEAQVRSLAVKEQECCRFFRFEVGRDGAEIVWVTRADDRAAAVLEEFFHLPERLLEEHDVRAVKAAAKRAGLAFSADAGEGANMNVPVACERSLSADEAQRHLANGRALFAMVEDVRHLADGWALRLPDAPDARDRLAAFLELNRRCCTHIRHAVVFEPLHGPMWLELSGGGETGKVAIASELVALLPSGLVPTPADFVERHLRPLVGA